MAAETQRIEPKGSRWRRAAPICPRSPLSRAASARDRAEDGFTLVELLIVCVVLPIIVGAISVALISVLSLHGGVSNRISDSADAQTVSSTFEKDVQSAAMLTTSASPTPSQCGSGTQLLGLEWNLNQSSGIYQMVVSYVQVQRGSTYSLVRQTCTGGNLSSPVGISTASSDISSTQLAPTITGTSSTAASSGWASAQGVTDVKFTINEPGSNYTYSLEAVPGANSSSNQTSSITNPGSNCGFANPGTGTYASTLCFVDFTSYDPNYSANHGGACQPISAAITNTPYTMTFCLSTSGGSVVAAVMPTYYAVSSQAFLGNNGFYTGVPGKPAMYQASTSSGTTSTVTITQIKVLDSNGNAATGWNLVTGDAETTDQGEAITWSVNSGKTLVLLPNTPTSPYGDACLSPTTSNPTATSLTWTNSNSTVTCSATISTPKTGTVMLESSTPTSLTVQLVGGGLQAMFLGVLLTS